MYFILNFIIVQVFYFSKDLYKVAKNKFFHYINLNDIVMIFYGQQVYGMTTYDLDNYHYIFVHLVFH